MTIFSEFFRSAYSVPACGLASTMAGIGRADQAMSSDHGERAPKHRILVVDDDSDVCEIIGCMLRQAGYEVDSVSDGEAGWNALLRHRYSVLLTDNRMPRLTGVELIERLRAAGSTMPAILASGTLPWEDANAPAKLQPVTTLWKPFNGFELLAKVRAALSRLVSASRPVPERLFVE